MLVRWKDMKERVVLAGAGGDYYGMGRQMACYRGDKPK